MMLHIYIYIYIYIRDFTLHTYIHICELSRLPIGGFHLYLVLTNQTTIEFHANMGNRDRARGRGELWRNPYDLGRRRNFQQARPPPRWAGRAAGLLGSKSWAA